MPLCPKCKSKISRLDKEICPFCGEFQPLKGLNYETMDITKVVGDPLLEDTILYRAKSKKVAIVLCIFLGFFGAHSFYVHKFKQGLYFILFTIFFIGGIGTLLFFTFLKGSFWAYLLPLLVEEVALIGLSFKYVGRVDLKDGRGELMR